MPRALTLLALLALASGCARHGEARTAEVHGADGGRYYALVYHFLAADDYDRASYVHGGESYREEMARHFAGRTRAERVRVVEVAALSDASAVVTARVSYADGTAGVVKVVVTKGEPALAGGLAGDA
jgi:hypothetical protein